MRTLVRPLDLSEAERDQLVDTAGTGGDDRGTFNISTGAALVAAAAGAKVAKHGNRALTSKCGSADVLEALGVPVEVEPEVSVECLRATGFMFLYAPHLHPALGRVQPVRRVLGFRTIFNLAAPTQPAPERKCWASFLPAVSPWLRKPWPKWACVMPWSSMGWMAWTKSL
jgi:anthranilate phosphoribosyltransferase